ncbi:reductase-like [Datura stramonium]|uniref:Reductase-like n=1 Tax=Datura stramonium TaxID=4076 RepID=A0ABS8UT79_DATST|nr:reductase-like [Datura stramonium]
MIHRNTHDYVALLSMHPGVLSLEVLGQNFLLTFVSFNSHFAIEESAVKPSTLSKYGVHGFPTLFLLNATMRMRYHGSRSLDSVIEFYGVTTGFQSASVDATSLGKTGCSNHLNRMEVTRKTVHFPGPDLLKTFFSRKHIWPWPLHLC